LRFRDIAHLPTRYPKWVLFAIAAITVSLASGLPRLKTVVDVDEDSLPKADQRVKDFLAVKDVFGALKPVTVVLDAGEGRSVFSPQQLTTIRDLSEKLGRQADLVPHDVTSLTEVSDVTFTDGSLDSRDVVGFPLEAGDPAKIYAQMLEHPLWPGRLFDDKKRYTILTANVATDASLDRLYDDLQQLLKAVEAPAEAIATGADVLPVALTRAIDHDMQIFVPLALLFVIVGFFLSFRTAGGVLLPLAVTVLTMVWLLGFMGLVGATLNPVTTVLPPTLIALGSSYGIHFMNRYYRLTMPAGGKGLAYETLRQVARPLVVAGATTALGMATLIVFEIEMVRSFGLLMALGIVFVVVLTLTFIPAVLSLRGSQDVCQHARACDKRPSFLPALLAHLGAACQRRARLVIVLTLLLSALGLVFCFRLEVGVDLVRYFPPEHAQRRANDLVSEKLGGAASATLMLEVDPKIFPHGARNPDFMAKLLLLGERLRRVPGVGHVRSLADVTYHIHRRIQRELAKDEGAAPKRVAPSSSKEIDQLLLLYSMGAGIQAIDDLEDSTRRYAAVSVALVGWDAVAHRRIFAAARRVCDDVFPRGAKLTIGGDAVLLLAFDHYIVKGKLINIALTVLVVFLLCGLVYRSRRYGLLSLVPVAFATVATFGLMSMLGYRLTLATVVIASIGIGVGIDFAVHFLDHFREQLGAGEELGASINATMTGIGPAVVYDASSNVLGFSPLVFSGMVPIQHFGWLISFCMIFSALATLVILPAALHLIGRQRLAFGKARTVASTTTSEVLTHG